MDECPRCSGLLNTNYEEPNCVCCGYTDYSDLSKGPKHPGCLNGITIVLRRHNTPRKNKVKSILMRQVRERFFVDECPFDGCSSLMEATKTVKKIPGFRVVKAFTCVESHIIYHVQGGDKEWWT